MYKVNGCSLNHHPLKDRFDELCFELQVNFERFLVIFFNMANPVYKISATLGGQYTPLIKRTRDCQVHMSKLELDALRASAAGASNIDLWVDGSLYPHNPLDLERRPRFKSVSELLEFTGEGKKGLLGYIESLCKVDKTIEFNLAETKKEVQFLRTHPNIATCCSRERLAAAPL